MNEIWKKERVLNKLKTELAAVERKIQLSIKPEPLEYQVRPADGLLQTKYIEENTLSKKIFFFPGD